MRIHMFIFAFLLALFQTGCTAQGQQEGENQLTVFAAAQLQDAFEEIKDVFEERYHVQVTLNFAGSQVVRTQIEQGAPADVFASADLSHMEDLQRLGRVGEDTIFSYNTLTILLPNRNPAELESLLDLAEKNYRLVIGVDDVPIGRYARQFLEKAERTFGPDYRENVLSNVVSYETNTRAVAGKVTLGEADAGIVYVSDVIPSIEDMVTTIDIPEELNVITTNTIAVTTDSKSPELGQKWIDFILSDEGQEILASHKFMKVIDVDGRGEGE